MAYASMKPPSVAPAMPASSSPQFTPYPVSHARPPVSDKKNQSLNPTVTPLITRLKDVVDASQVPSGSEGVTQANLTITAKDLRLTVVDGIIVKQELKGFRVTIQIIYRSKESPSLESTYGLGPTVRDHEEAHVRDFREFLATHPFAPNLVGIAAADASDELTRQREAYEAEMNTFSNQRTHCTGEKKIDC